MMGTEKREQTTTCTGCGTTIIVGEDCPNYGWGPEHA